MATGTISRPDYSGLYVSRSEIIQVAQFIRKMDYSTALLRLDLTVRGLRNYGRMTVKRVCTYAGNTKYRHGVYGKSSCAYIDPILSIY
ncbi:hypothetical protein Golomagni_05646 [Golovinomyces magnicellulatus]|nr:hypothetical protein Golomagni_05646 [Golovinomyces magnicellulatus]